MPQIPYRYRPQFGLRALIVAIGALSLLFGWTAHVLRQECARRALASRVESMGGSASYDGRKQASWRYDLKLLRHWFGDDTCANLERIWFVNEGNVVVADDYLSVLLDFPKVPRVDLQGRGFTDTYMAPLTGVSGLKELRLQETKITAEGLRRLSSAESLTALSVESVPNADQLLQGLAEWKQLERLTLNYTDVTSKGLAILNQLPNLRYLYLKPSWTGSSWNMDFLNDEALLRISCASKLEELWIEKSSHISDKGVHHLRKLQQLRSVGLIEIPSITVKGATSLATLPHLRRVVLCSAEIGDEGFRELMKLKELEDLSLSCANISDAALLDLPRQSRIQELELSETPISDAALLFISQLKNLKSLKLRGTKITDSGLVHLRNLRKLKFLLIEGTPTTEAGRAQLNRWLPTCDVYD